MPISSEMRDAIRVFGDNLPEDCVLDPKADKPIYTLIKIEGWPSTVHYEFRYSQRSGLFVELHIEDPAHAGLGSTFRKCRDELLTIEGLSLGYYESRPAPNRKKWPSLSLELGHGVAGSFAAKVMLAFILATRGEVTRALGY